MPPEKQPAFMKSEFLFDSAPFAECHASTIVQAKDGHLLAAWFGGTREGHKDVCIWLSHQEGDKWLPPQRVADGQQAGDSRHPCWNPVLFQPRTGPLMLFYKVGPSPSQWWGMLITSENSGRTWSEPRRLPEGILGPIKNKPVQLSNGDLLCPSSSEDHGWRVHFERTSDLGNTWARTEAVNDGREFGAIQPSILFQGTERLQAVGRTRQGVVFQIWSEDNGRTWGKMTATSLPNPNAGTDALTLSDGRHVIVYNHTTRGRSPLNVAVSKDGQNWNMALVLEDSPGEYSYPAVVQTQNGFLQITYTWKRQKIRHAVLEPAKL